MALYKSVFSNWESRGDLYAALGVLRLSRNGLGRVAATKQPQLCRLLPCRTADTKIDTSWNAQAPRDLTTHMSTCALHRVDFVFLASTMAMLGLQFCSPPKSWMLLRLQASDNEID
jgi:hypothetical protein